MTSIKSQIITGLNKSIETLTVRIQLIDSYSGQFYLQEKEQLVDMRQSLIEARTHIEETFYEETTSEVVV